MRIFKKKKFDFNVELKGRSGLIYVEKDHRAFMETELLIGCLADMVVYFDTLNKWLPPHEEEEMSEEKRLEIRANLHTYFESNSIEVEWT